MSEVNSTILALSQQIAILQAENERLQREIERPVQTRPKPVRQSRASRALSKWVTKIEYEKYEQLLELYRDDIELIRRRFPRWKPASKFFDSKG